jgi:hypothetical protein
MTLNVDSSLVQILRAEFGPGWTIDDDRRFWKRIQAGAGLRRMCKDAQALEELCRRLSEDSSDREFMKYRSMMITLCLWLSRLEHFARIIYRNLPHFFARFAAELFVEMISRAELVAEEKAPELLDFFGEIDGKASGTVTNRAPARRTAPGTA